ncbi:hypothetical protein L596_028419 [Steinernema carpocapsae]|uniref:SH2 domain-containing protein n=1 Tax=Steinernema carpocapsae TaxID=34508 RepID=A0A4U5LYI1_STECR|nr:hypothetical protein L596_028419 [Steinernema carpocapsae]
MSTHPHSPLFLSESRSVAMWKMSDFTQPPSPRNNEALIERESRKREDQAEEELRVNPWFHGRIPKDEAEDLLQFDGQFLVRFAKDKTDGVVKTVLSSLWNGTHSHFLVREQMGLFGIEESRFETIPSLIEFHQMRQKPLTHRSGALIIEPVHLKTLNLGKKLLVPYVLKLTALVVVIFTLYFSNLFKPEKTS